MCLCVNHIFLKVFYSHWENKEHSISLGNSFKVSIKEDITNEFKTFDPWTIQEQGSQEEQWALTQNLCLKCKSHGFLKE